MAKEFLTRGTQVFGTPQEGDVIVDINGKHCGIFDDSIRFVHASSRLHKAVERHSSQLTNVFGDKYQIRRLQ